MNPSSTPVHPGAVLSLAQTVDAIRSETRVGNLFCASSYARHLNAHGLTADAIIESVLEGRFTEPDDPIALPAATFMHQRADKQIRIQVALDQTPPGARIFVPATFDHDANLDRRPILAAVFVLIGFIPWFLLSFSHGLGKMLANMNLAGHSYYGWSLTLGYAALAACIAPGIVACFFRSLSFRTAFGGVAWFLAVVLSFAAGDPFIALILGSTAGIPWFLLLGTSKPTLVKLIRSTVSNA